MRLRLRSCALSSSSKSGSAATLVAVVLVMAVAGTMLAVKMAGEQGSDYNAKVKETYRRIDFVNKRIIQKQAEVGHLFRPANSSYPVPDPNKPRDTTNYWGVASVASSDNDPTHLPKKYIRTDTVLHRVLRGDLPLSSLNIDDIIYMFDAWGNRFVYEVDEEATEETSCKALQLAAAKNASNAAITIEDKDGNVKDHVFYAILSLGKDGNYSVPMEGAAFDKRKIIGPGDELTKTNGVPKEDDFTNVLVKAERTSTFDDILADGGAYKRTCCLKPSCLAASDPQVGIKFTGQDAYDVAAWDLAIGDVNGDNIDDVVIGAPYENAVYVIYGNASGLKKTIPLGGLDGTNGFVIRNPGGHLFGYSVSVGDVDGDGILDIGIGDPNALPAQNVCPQPLANKAYVVKGSTSFPKLLTFTSVGGVWGPPGTTGFAFGAPNLPPNFGYSTLLADINNDGIADFCVSSLNDVHCMYGHAGLFPVTPAYVDANSLIGASTGFKVTPDANLTNDPAHPLSHSGAQMIAPTLAAGDVNGDTIKDLIIGAAHVTPPTGEVRAGAVYVVFGKHHIFPDEVLLASLNVFSGTRIDGIDAAGKLGSAVASADINFDGISDVIAGATHSILKLTYNSSGAIFCCTPVPGKVYVVYGKHIWPNYSSIGSLNASTGLVIGGAANGDNFGAALATADVNNDGIPDIIAGAPTEGAAGEGGGYIIYGRDTTGISGPPNTFAATMDVTSPDGITVSHYFGTYPGQAVGWAVAGGNVNNTDGKDVAIAAPFANFGGGIDSGGGYVVYGPFTAINVNLDSM